MKVIDLLNKIANGEEVPNKIKHKGTIYEYIERCDETYNYADKFNYYLEDKYYLSNILEHEIEIIEEDKEIEEIPFNNGMKEFIDVYHELEHYNYKINELIKVVNKLKKGK